MRWSDITADWSYWATIIRGHFPRLSLRHLEMAQSSRDAFEASLANLHDLTVTEAREEINDLIYVQTLAREVMASEYHADETDRPGGISAAM